MSFSAQILKHVESPITYDEALLRIARLASTPVSKRDRNIHGTHEDPLRGLHSEVNASRDSMPLLEAVGCKSSRTLHAPHSTPRTDTSAMDGFAVNAKTTLGASEACPLRLRIVESISAGDDQSRIGIDLDSQEIHRICVEIMTGACFPEQRLPHLDSVVKIEDVVLEENRSEDGSILSRYVLLNKPVKPFQHRRPAGSDFTKGEVIIEYGTIVEPKHVAALASLGNTHIGVLAYSYPERPQRVSTDARSSLRVGVFSTGSEIVTNLNHVKYFQNQDTSFKQAIPDSNGPYLVSSLRSTFPRVAVEHLGIIRDDEEELAQRLEKAVFEDNFDVIISSGGVSKGRHDLVRHVIENRLQGTVVFHGVKIRPGAPVLCAAFDRLEGAGSKAGRRQTIFFGAPGNPLATAVTLRFFIMPYLISVSSMGVEQRVRHDEIVLVSPMNRLDQDQLPNPQPLCRKPEGLTAFRLARRQAADVNHVEFVEDQASYKLRVLLNADCWVIVPPGMSEVFCGDRLVLSPL